ncbi:aldolase citrate lyase family protein [Phlyctema vagabunda]|uniref:Aldolase citrate lyase family protein n=1 Tax=Phlyctema vagabunda TaxID=108571 RepID=A0ABR4PAT0_9HELO
MDLPYSDQPKLHTKAPYRAALLQYPGNFKEALKQAKSDPAKTLFGAAHGIPSVYVTKIIASTRPDFIWIDVEHGIFDRRTLYDAVQAVQHHSEGHTVAVVRVPKHDETALSTALEAGAAAIIIPHCESAEEVRAFVRETYFPPEGQRSYSPWTFTPGISDASLYDNDPFNFKSSNNHITLIPQIETVKGIENLDEIAAVPEVGALMFGPVDYMADAGIPLKISKVFPPDLVAAIEKFAAAGEKHGKPLFGAAMAPEMIPHLIKQGYRAICVGFDTAGLARFFKGGLDTAKQLAQQ